MLTHINIKIDDSFCRDDYISDDELDTEVETNTQAHGKPVLEPLIIKTNLSLDYQIVHEYYSDGTLKYEKYINTRTNKALGPFKQYYPTGILMREGYMDNDLIQNQVKTYYPSGSLAFYQEYDDGYLNGTSILYYKSGKIAQKLNYKRVMATCDNKYKDYVSLIDGEYYEFEENSTIKTHVIYKLGCIEEIKYCCKLSYIIPSTNYTICI